VSRGRWSAAVPQRSRAWPLNGARGGLRREPGTCCRDLVEIERCDNCARTGAWLRGVLESRSAEVKIRGDWRLAVDFDDFCYVL